MKKSPAASLKFNVETIFNVLENDGVVVLPSKLGYGIIALTSQVVFSLLLKFLRKQQTQILKMTFRNLNYQLV